MRGLLRAKLPEYMIPSAFVVLDRFPMTPNGKVDRKALPAPEERKIGAGSDVAPLSYTEQVVCGIWRERLNLERVGTQDNFFELGGHSLLAVRVVNEINKVLRVSLTVLAMYQNQTVERLAIAIDRERQIGSWSRFSPLRSGRAGLSICLIGSGAAEYQVGQSIKGDRPIFLFDTFEWHRAIAAEGPMAVPSIGQMGETCGALLHAHAGSGPCVILGYCINGKIAFEAAHAVLRAGGRVAAVVLFDTIAAGGGGLTRGPPLQSVRWIWRRATTAVANASYLAGLGGVLRDSGRLLLWLLARAPYLVRRYIRMAQRPPSGFLDNRGAPIELGRYDASLRLVGKEFRPRPLDAAGVLIRAKVPGEEMLPGFDVTRGWSGLFTRGLDVVATSGDHFDMFDEKNFKALAEKINLVLDQYDNGSHAGRGPTVRERQTADAHD